MCRWYNPTGNDRIWKKTLTSQNGCWCARASYCKNLPKMCLDVFPTNCEINVLLTIWLSLFLKTLSFSLLLLSKYFWFTKHWINAVQKSNRKLRKIRNLKTIYANNTYCWFAPNSSQSVSTNRSWNWSGAKFTTIRFKTKTKVKSEPIFIITSNH